MSNRSIPSWIFILLFLISCGTAKKSAVTEEKPERRLPPLPQSEINIPVRLNIRTLAQVMDSSTSKEFTSDKWPDYTQPSCDFRYKYRFIRSPFSFTCINNRVNINFQGRYQIAGSRCLCAFGKQVSPWANGSCGYGNEPLRRVDIRIASQLDLLPDHHIRTTTHIDNLVNYDKCNVTLLQNDITPEIIDSIKASVESYCSAFDRFVQDINNNSLLQAWRTGGSRVFPISHYGYLNLNPTRYQVSQINIANDTLYFSLGFRGTPLFSSDSARLVTGTPLPPLSKTGFQSGIRMYLDLDYDYSFFNRLLNDSLANQPFEVEGKTFVIKEIGVRGGSDGKIRLDIAFTGNRNGVLHLSGTPTLDTSSQVLTMPDINFSLDSRDMLLNIAKGLFRKKVMRQLQGKSVFDIAALVTSNQQIIEARLNQPVTDWLRTSGKLHQLKILGILAGEHKIQIQAYLEAEISFQGRADASLLKGF